MAGTSLHDTGRLTHRTSMKYLIIPGLPLAAIYGSQTLGAHLPLVPACILSFLILIVISTYLFLWLLTGQRPKL